MSRISREEMLMAIVRVVSCRSTCQRRRVGAVIARAGRVLSIGYNGVPSGMPHCTELTCTPDKPCTDTIHAEANAIAFAAKSGIPIQGATLYCSASPCLDCAKLIINSGIETVIFDDYYRVRDGLHLLIKAQITVSKHYAPR